jgi:hypothetical protein
MDSRRRPHGRGAGSAVALLLTLALAGPAVSQSGDERPRARDAGVVVGIMPPGPLNAITDVAGVRVGQTTVVEGSTVRTGVTAVLPHGGDLFRSRVPAAIVVGNGFGKLVGETQVRELGELETPVLLTCTLCVWQAADAMTDWLLAQPGHGAGPLDQSGGRRDQRWRAQRHPVQAGHRRPRGSGSGVGQRRAGTGGERGGRYGHGGLRLEGRDRHVVAQAPRPAGWLDGGGAGAEQLWRRPHHERRARGSIAGPSTRSSSALESGRGGTGRRAMGAS